jgi:manganese transport protein
LEEPEEDVASSLPASHSPALLAASASTVVIPASFGVSRSQIWSYFGPAFVASVAYIDPGNFATNIEGGSRFGYRLLWVLLWSNAMAILIQYLSAKLGIVTGRTLPQNCRKHFPRPVTLGLWVAAEVSAIATDLAEFLGAALGFYLLFGPALLAHGWSRTGTLLAASLVSAVAFHTLIPTLDTGSGDALHKSIYLAVGMLGATVMPHVIYLHSSLVQPRRKDVVAVPHVKGTSRRRQYLRFELIDVIIAMNGAWIINSAMIVMAAVAFARSGAVVTDVEQAYRTLGPLLGPAAATVFAVALLCSGLSSSTVGVMAGQVIIEGFLHIKFPIFLRRLITIIPAIVIIAAGLDPLRILILSQVVLSFTLPFALIPLLLLTSRKSVMDDFSSATRTRLAGWVCVAIIITLNAVLLGQLAFGG